MGFRSSAVSTFLVTFAVACGNGTPSLPAQPRSVPNRATMQAVRVLAARADSFEKGNAWRDAADTWASAAERFPALGDWFLLKAAAAHPDGRQRDEWLRAVLPLPTSDSAALVRRKAGSHLRALLRHGDTTTAIAHYVALGNTRDSVVAFSLRERRGEPLTDTARVQFATAAARIGDSPLARRLYGELLGDRSPLLTDMHRYQYGALLFDAGQHDAATRVWAATSGAYAGRAAYQQARAQLRLGRAAAARTLLRQVTTAYAADSTAAGNAWYLLGDLASDDGNDTDAMASWSALAVRYPSHPLADRAAFRRAIALAAAGRWSDAEPTWRTLAARAGDEQSASRYWLGRALFQQERRALAQREWRALISDVPDSYYALLAARRLGTAPWSPNAVARTSATEDGAGLLDSASVAFALTRAAWLDSLQLLAEARDERGDLVRTASRTAPDVRRAAAAFVAQQRASSSMQLAARLPQFKAPLSPDDQRLRFPLPFGEALTQYAAREALDVSFVAALIRQESRFTADARSVAGARGLMQVMPAVGRALGASMGIRPWHDSLLYVPDVNVRVGTRHLAAAVRSDGRQHPAYALAAYNAGRSRMIRWRAKRGAATDWELFVERIPYVETRDYVRIVLRNEEWYRVLYPAPAQDE